MLPRGRKGKAGIDILTEPNLWRLVSASGLKMNESSKEDREDIAGLKFTGTRFNVPGFPVDFASELENYQNLINEMAKTIWLRNNYSAERVPDHFETILRLRMISFKDGSLIPILDRENDLPLPESDSKDLLSLTIEEIDNTFESIIKSSFDYGRYSPNLLKALKKLGTKLKVGEAITFKQSSATPLVYDFGIRRRFVQSLDVNEETQLTLIGAIRTLDTQQAFILRQLNGTQINGVFSKADIFDDLHKVHSLRKQVDLIWMTCSCELKKDSLEIKRIKDVFQVGIFSNSSNPWVARLAELANKPDGWLDGAGSHLDLITLEAGLNLLNQLPSNLHENVSLFADEEGNLRIELLLGNSHIVISVSEVPDFSLFFYDSESDSSFSKENIKSQDKALHEFYRLIDG